MKELIIVIPVLSNNRHFKDGDLKQISGISLVQWKINQMSTLIESYSTYLFSKDMIKLLNNQKKVVFVEREDELVGSMISKIKKMFCGKCVLWINCNVPFVNEKTIIDAIIEFKGQIEYTSLVPVVEENSFFVFNDEPINFSLKDELSRDNNLTLQKLANSFYIFDVDSIKSNLITDNPLYYNISKKESYELDSDISESEIKNRFIEFLVNIT